MKSIFLIFLFLFFVSAGAEEVDLLEEDAVSTEGQFMEKIQNLKIKTVEDLVHLIPFSDISVIQRRFMPKTGRLSFSTSAAFILSSEFFVNPGAEAHLSYHFLEKHSLEISGYYTVPLTRQVSKDLAYHLDVQTSQENPIASKFMGVSYKWMPIYGKAAFFNRKIVAFDTFFSIGGGVSQPSNSKIWEPAGFVGLGQVFAVTRDFGLRWDLRWHITVQTKNSYRTLNDVLFTIGLIYYYPSVRTR